MADSSSAGLSPEENLVHRAGLGRRHYPFSYCLPEKKEEWQHLPEEFVRCPEEHDLRLFMTDPAEVEALIKANEAAGLGPVAPIIRPSSVAKARGGEDEGEEPLAGGGELWTGDVG